MENKFTVHLYIKQSCIIVHSIVFSEHRGDCPKLIPAVSTSRRVQPLPPIHMCTTRTAWETFKRFFKVLEPTVQHVRGNIDKTDQNAYVQV